MRNKLFALAFILGLFIPAFAQVAGYRESASGGAEATTVANTSTVGLTLSTYQITADINSTLKAYWDAKGTSNLTGLGDVVATAPVTINGTTSVNDILVGSDVDYTIALTLTGDLVATAPVLINGTTAVNNIIPGGDMDYTISLPKATAAADGYLNMTDWSTFNNKGTSNVTANDTAYAAGWDGSTQIPTQNTLYDKIQTLGAGGAISFYNQSVLVGNNTALNLTAGSGIAIAASNSSAGATYTITASGGGGNVSSNGAITANHIAFWKDANTINDSGIDISKYGTSNQTGNVTDDGLADTQIAYGTATPHAIGSEAAFKYISGTDKLIVVNIAATGFINGTTLDTGNGANELYAMNQNVTTTSNVVFNNITGKAQNKVKSFSIYNITDSFDVLLWKSQSNLTLLGIDTALLGATNVVGMLEVANATGYLPAKVNATDWTTTTAGLSVTSFANATVFNQSWLFWNSTSVSGTPSNFAVTIRYSEN